MKEEQKTTLVHAINHFGVEGQINKAVEEMGGADHGAFPAQPCPV